MKYDMQDIESQDIELCAIGENLFAAFYDLWSANKICSAEYKTFLDHRRACQECKDVVIQSFSVGL